ncbi:MAG: nuclear transport factor 2 family protein [Acidimicrobiia bacterium]
MNLEGLVAQQEIRDVLIRYTRGIDRMDPELVRSTYWPGAYDDHGAFQGTVEGFIDWVQEVLAYFDTTMHFIGNQLVEVDGDTAHAESYCVANHRRRARDGEEGHDLVIGLRYVDRLERRDSEWRIADRKCVFDWTRHDPINAEWDLPPEALRGSRDYDDPVFGR